jgi:hypothetical protein
MVRLGVLTLLLAAPAAAQDVLGAPSDAAVLSAVDRSSAPPAEVTPLSLALSLAFDATTWAAVGVSTASPAGDVAELMARGYYRLEILQLTLLAEASGKRLLDLRTRRTKDGLTLRALAEEARVPYDALLDRAEALAAGVERRAKDLRSVESLRGRKEPR